MSSPNNSQNTTSSASTSNRSPNILRSRKKTRNTHSSSAEMGSSLSVMGSSKKTEVAKIVYPEFELMAKMEQDPVYYEWFQDCAKGKIPSPYKYKNRCLVFQNKKKYFRCERIQLYLQPENHSTWMGTSQVYILLDVWVRK